MTPACNHVRVETCCFETGKGVSEYHVTLHVMRTGDPFADQLAGIREALSCLLRQYGERVHPVFMRYFLSDAANQIPVMEAYGKEAFPCAVSVVQQPPLDGSRIALWVYLKSDVEITASPHGVLEEHNGYRYLWTAGCRASGKDSGSQTESLFRDYAAGLERERYSLESHCLRTWLFVQNIDRNYGGVVRTRKDFFARCRMTEQTHYIVSTGIEGRCADPESLVMLDACAVKGLQEGQLNYLHAPSHFSPTHTYGVTFERGVHVAYGDRSHVLLAGTASIDSQGEIVHPNDAVKQTCHMLENMEALLQEAGLSLDHAVQMIVYLRDRSDYPAVSAILEARFGGLPKIFALALVCRPGWLVEAECIAVKAQENPRFRAL
jgi:enamine deaminase RidA (YjgF/YER057c/UK114 family)